MQTHLIIQLSTHREPVHKLCHWSHQGTDTEGSQIRNSLCSFLHWDKDRRLEWKNREYAGTMGTCTNTHLIIELPDFPHHISHTYVCMFVHIICASYIHNQAWSTHSDTHKHHSVAQGSLEGRGSPLTEGWGICHRLSSMTGHSGQEEWGLCESNEYSLVAPACSVTAGCLYSPVPSYSSQ